MKNKKGSLPNAPYPISAHPSRLWVRDSYPKRAVMTKGTPTGGLQKPGQQDSTPSESSTESEKSKQETQD
jgi:hypothetical protein